MSGSVGAPGGNPRGDPIYSYVLAVTAYADDGDDDEAKLALAEALLAPIGAWRGPGGRTGRGGPRRAAPGAALQGGAPSLR